MKPRRPGSGFTLVELLVVIAVIALLTGVLLPALGNARTAGQASASASNLRQLQLANELHAGDYDERLVAGAPEFREKNLARWHGERDALSEAFDAERSPLTPYLENERISVAVRTCPGFIATAEDLLAGGRGFELSSGGYGYNNAFMGTQRRKVGGGVWTIVTDTQGERRTNFRRPTETVAFSTTAFAADELIEYSFVEPAEWPEFPGFRPDPSMHFRFNGRAPIVWLGGHLSSEALAFTHRSGLYPADPERFDLGWFGETATENLFDTE